MPQRRLRSSPQFSRVISISLILGCAQKYLLIGSFCKFAHSHRPSNSRWMGIGGLLMLELHVYLFTICFDFVGIAKILIVCVCRGELLQGEG